jgi:hypothetical protein
MLSFDELQFLNGILQTSSTHQRRRWIVCRGGEQLFTQMPLSLAFGGDINEGGVRQEKTGARLRDRCRRDRRPLDTVSTQGG